MPYDDYKYSGGYRSSYRPTRRYSPSTSPSPTRGRTRSYRRDEFPGSRYSARRDRASSPSTVRAKSPSTVRPIDSSSLIYVRENLGIRPRSPPRFSSPPHRYRSPTPLRTRSPLRPRYRAPSPKYSWERRSSPSRYRYTSSPARYFSTWSKRPPTPSPERSSYSTTATKTYGSSTPLYSTDKEAKYDVTGRDFHIYDYDGMPMASSEHKDGKRTWRLWDTDVSVARNSDGDLEFYKRLANLKS